MQRKALLGKKKFSPPRAGPLGRCELQASAGCADLDARPNKPTQQAEPKPCFVPGEGETGCARGLGAARDGGTAWGTGKPQPCPPALALSISHLSPAHGVIAGCCTPAVGKAQFVRRGEQKTSCTTMPGFSCATLIALRPLCAPGRWPGPGGLQILRLRCPRASFGVLQKKIHAFGVTPGKIHGRTAVMGSSGAGCILPCCLGGRQRSDPKEAACGCSSLGNLDWSHTVIPVISCKRNIKRCQTDLAKGSSALPRALQSMQKLCR